jgi:hypothetical protein
LLPEEVSLHADRKSNRLSEKNKGIKRKNLLRELKIFLLIIYQMIQHWKWCQ